uniref:SHC-transforming protein 3 n=2 Tax=Gadus morhua TaxID=8049 RepID=A0A8C5F4D6_GADMO
EKGMLHRTKYNRFRNESVTSVDDLLHGLSMNSKVHGSPASGPATGSSACTSSCSQLEPAPGCMHKKGRPDEAQPGAEDRTPGRGGGGGTGAAATTVTTTAAGLVSKPPRGWLHSSEKISGPGVTYIVNYLGCIEVLRSMRSLDFTTRSQITREAISLVCEAVPGTKGAPRKRKPPSKALSNILGKSNLQFAGMSINLNISTSSLNLMTPDSKQIIANHHMQSISFASGGDPDTTDYVAYVAKDPVNRRACHILECSDSLAQDVISSIGQAFDLRFQQYLQCPSSKPSSTHDRVLNMEEFPWTEEEEEPAEHPYYNNIPGKMPPPGGFIDSRLAGQGGASDGGQDAIHSQPPPCHPGAGQPLPPACCSAAALHKASSVDNCSPLLARAVAPRGQEELGGQAWYHGQMSRRDAEKLLRDDGDFLVRKSTTNPGSYVLTGMHHGLAKHLLLVDPEGTVRTKDHIFDSINHLIGHHRDNSLPIVSAGSELCLKQPVGRK